jgi:glycerol transport system ATP-binding protein
LLNVISGLLKPSRGRVLYDGKDVTGLPPEKRNIAQVFQFPVLYDTMSVFDNLAFPLKNRGFNKTDTARRVQEVAEILDLTQDLNKKAAGLSRRCQTENIPGPRPGAKRCGGRALR